MRRHLTTYVVASGVMLVSSVSAQTTDERVLEMLEKYGDQVVLPEGYQKIPGFPAVLTAEQMTIIAENKRQYEQQGFVNVKHLPRTAGLLDYIRSEMAKKRIGQESISGLYDLDSFNLAGRSDYSPGRVRPEFLKPTSKGYVFVGGAKLTRVYADTQFGDIYIDEGGGGRLVVLGNEPGNLHIGGYQGYAVTLRHPDGQFATVAVIPTDAGVLEVEVGIDVKARNLNTEFESFLAGLLTEKEVH